MLFSKFSNPKLVGGMIGSIMSNDYIEISVLLLSTSLSKVDKIVSRN